MAGTSEGTASSEDSDTPSSEAMQRPQIVVFDAEPIAVALTDRRFTVETATFGRAFEVEPDDAFIPVPTQIEVSGLAEADIIIADLAGPAVGPVPDDLQEPPIGLTRVWAPAKHGVVDPRPLGMHLASDLIDRAHRHGSCLVIVADTQLREEFVIARRGHGGLLREHDRPMDNWGLLSKLRRFDVQPDGGRTMTRARPAADLKLDSSIWTGRFTCTIEAPEGLPWYPLATNKFGATVAGLLLPADDSDEGWVVILPRLDNIEAVVADLVERVFSQVAPKLFPELEGAAWTSDPTYEHDDVVALRMQVGEIEAQAAAKVVAIEEEIAAARERQQHLHTLLTGTDDELVQAIITTLGDLGFGNVVDIDAERDAAGDTGDKREDVRIGETGKPLVLGEVKGIAGLPKEANALQVWKYLTPRMKELKRTDIRGLSIVNQQRNLPPLEREHKNVFQNDVLTTADANEITLMTTWELYRLSRNATRHGWPFEAVRDLFYTDGRVDIVPSHYDEIGVVEEVWPKSNAFAVTLTAPLAAATTIAVEGPIDFEELADVSIMLDDESVSDASTGQKVGVGLQALPDVVKRGRRLFAVRPLPRAAASGDEVDGDS